MAGARARLSWWRCARLCLLATALPCAAHAQDADGLHWTPSLSWKSGDHRLDVGLVDRFRVEGWDAFTDETDFYTANRARLRLAYTWRDLLSLAGEVQDLRLNGLSPDLTGTGATYRASSGGDDDAGGTGVRQLFLELRPVEGAFARVGRQDVKLGAEAAYSEPDWRYLKTFRLGERLVGTVGWTQAERAYDGVAAGLDRGGHLLYAFAARPTTGLFDVDSAYRDMRQVEVGGFSWTVERNTWLPNAELEAFAVAYKDDRATDHGGLAKGVLIYTVGGSFMGIAPLGPGKVDLLLWSAGQWGRYSTLHQGAQAGMLELGYRLPDLPAQPWLRVGVNAASGDSDPTDRRHGTFFNVLPTNHPYYGFADQLAFQNLVDSFLQLRLTPHEKLGLNLFVHRFVLASKADARYSGSGAFNESVFGFNAQASRGRRNVGTEYDAVATLTPDPHLTLEVGYSFLAGGGVLDINRDPDVHFGYASVEVRY